MHLIGLKMLESYISKDSVVESKFFFLNEAILLKIKKEKQVINGELTLLVGCWNPY